MEKLIEEIDVIAQFKHDGKIIPMCLQMLIGRLAMLSIVCTYFHIRPLTCYIIIISGLSILSMKNFA